MRKVFAATMLLVLASPVLAHDSGAHATGTVADLSASTIVVTTSQGERRFRLTPSTRFSRGGTVVQRGDVHTGDRVVVHGDKADGDIEARDVRVAPSAKEPK